MDFNFNVKRKYKFNNKEYNSLDEMPPDVRTIFEKAAAEKLGGYGINASPKTKIVFNGTEYESIDKMPADIRKLYEDIMKASESQSPKIPMGNTVPAMQLDQVTRDVSVSKGALVAIVLIGGLIILGYYLLTHAR